MTPNNKYRILFIDDEEVNLRVFQSTFHWDYDVITAISAEKGEAILFKEQVDLIITDQRMPGKTGVEFLETILPHFPDIPRILITGYTDSESIINAVNKAKIFQYISKPWEKEQVELVMEKALEDSRLKIKNHQLISNLKESNIHLISALKELDSFIYKASHDLMSPITTILGLVNLEQLEGTIEEKDSYVKKIGDTAKKMKYFLSHLTLVNIVHDKSIDLKQTNLTKLLEQYKSYSRESFHIDFKIKRDINCVTDDVLLNIALSQIIENSLKYSHPQRPGVVWFEIKENNNEILISVEDNGIGINADYSEQYFNMFFKGGESSGSGIGLYIAKKVVEKLHGKIWISGEVDKGTTVNIQLPTNIDKENNQLPSSKLLTADM